LGEMYEIRSYVEHLHPPLDALSSVPAAARLAHGQRRTRQGEVLARFAFAHVLESPDLLAAFQTETGIDGFWRRPDHERMALWGARCDVGRVP
jgi:hypothetical protein